MPMRRNYLNDFIIFCLKPSNANDEPNNTNDGGKGTGLRSPISKATSYSATRS